LGPELLLAALLSVRLLLSPPPASGPGSWPRWLTCRRPWEVPTSLSIWLRRRVHVRPSSG
jgi:hypothetical protein